MSTAISPELIKTVALLATSITIVPLFKRLGLGSVLGYLVAGCLIGPSVFKVVEDPESVIHMAELGVVMFLFIIGLEMHPERLWAMRKAIFGRGFLQVALCGTLLTCIGIFILGMRKEVAFIAGMGFTLSSTAIVMQVLDERGLTATAKGQRIISTLIFEDLAIVPLLASIAFLAPDNQETAPTDWTSIGIALAAVIGLIVAGKWLMNPIFRLISKVHIREMMTAAALLVVLGAALAMEVSGLSMAMGAFVAGVMLSESAFRHQLEADIEPFRGLLLGLFFMGVGMSLDLTLVANNALWLLGIVLLYVTGKALAVYVVARVTRLSKQEAFGRMIIMAHGGEFAFVLFSSALSAGVLTKDQNATLTAAVIISMLLSPLISVAARRIMQKRQANKPDEPVDTSGLEPIEDLQDSVLVLGFGRFSQVVCQTLLLRGINVSVIDRNIENIRTAAKFGFKVYYGDGIRLDVLHAAGIEKVKCVVIGLNDTDRIAGIVHQLKEAYPNLPILTRTYDRKTTVELIKQDVDFIVRETFESAITLSKATLMQLGINSMEADEVIEQVRYLDQERLNEEVLHGFSTDIVKKYWMPKPFIKPHVDAKPLNEETAEILAEEKMEKEPPENNQ